MTYGHLEGQGPIFGLGPDAVTNWQILSTTPPYFGFLDELGTARLDAPVGTLPASFALDAIVLLQDPNTGAFTLMTDILELDA